MLIRGTPLRLTNREVQQGPRPTPAVSFIIAIVALLGGAATADSAVKHHSCGSKGSRVVLRTNAARIFHHDGETFGCLYSAGKIVDLGPYRGDDFGSFFQRDLRLAGRYAALGQATVGPRLIDYEVVVFDLRTGRRHSSTPTGASPPASLGQSQGPIFGVGPTTDIGLRARGEVAWIAQDAFTQGTTRYEIHKREGPTTVLLAEGTDVDPVSLQLQGSTLSWVQGAQPNQTTLGPART